MKRSSFKTFLGGCPSRRAVAVLFGAMVPAVATSQQYYCPRANIMLTDISSTSKVAQEVFAGIGGAPFHFPRDAREVESNGGDLDGIALKMEDCSNAEFLCRRVSQHNWDQPPISYFLMVPRVISPGRVYELNGIRMLVRPGQQTWESNKHLVQVTIWQKIGNLDLPVELTIAPERGVIFWDGLRFHSTEAGNAEPELCLLTSKAGLFSNVRIAWPRSK
jgi:hypothetical protein